MTLSDRSLKKLRDFLNPTVKVKHRFTSLNSFHESASDLELAEFYEENWEMILVFTFECYLLMISKVWVIESASHRNCSVFAFGQELIAEEAADAVEDSLIKQVRLACERITAVNSEERDKWASSLRREHEAVAEFLKFPLVFTKLLQLVPAARLLSSSLSGLLVALITRLLHAKNVPVFRVEGLKMLLTWLKTSSYSGDGESAAEDCIRLFNSLVSVDCLDAARCRQDFDGDELLSHSSTILLHGPPLLSVAGANDSVPVDAEAAFRENLSMLNEVFAFITWDMNPDLHSTRFLWSLLRDHYLSVLFPEAYKSSSKSSFRQGSRISACNYDLSIRPEVLEIFVDYMNLWLIKSGSGSSNRLSAYHASAVAGTSTSGSASMLNLAVNDLSNLFSVLGRTRSSSVLGVGSGRHDIPVSSFLLEEIILGCPEDVRFVHLVLRSACTVLPYSKCLSSIKLILEILRSWTFNPPARRPAFLAGVDDAAMDEFVEFYVQCLQGLFPNAHVEADFSQDDDVKVTLADRLDVYKEAVYFIRALALQAFVSLSPERWLQIIDLLLEVTEYLLSPKNVLERPFLSNEDSLLCESVLGCLMRAGLPTKTDLALKARWQEASRILMLCARNDGLIEEWCRVVETLSTLVVKDARYLQGSVSRTVSATSPRVSSPIVSPSPSISTLPPITASFSAWPDHPFIRANSIALFRNVLRILGDPSLLEGLKKTPELLTKIYESLERVCNVFLKCRSNQSVKVEASAVPPIADLLPAVLAAVLNLGRDEDELPDIYAPVRTVCWRILGKILFRPADISVPEHFWAALLLASRKALALPTMEVGEITAFLQFIALPISTAAIPGCLLIMNDIVDALLRFFNDSLWSGQIKLSSREAAAILPPTMRFCLNAWSLSAVNPGSFGHFRDPSCLLRLFKLLVASLTDPDLLGLIYASAAAAFLNDFSRDVKDELVECLFEMMLEALRLERGVKAALAVSDYISALAYFPSEFTNAFRERLLFTLIEACRLGMGKSEQLIVDLVQGPLSDWLLHHLNGRFPNEACKTEFLSLTSVLELDSDQWTKAPSACASIFALSQRLLIYRHIFPGSPGPSLLGSLPEKRKPVLCLAFNPSSTLLSFEVEANENDVVYVTSRSPFGCFTWKFEKSLKQTLVTSPQQPKKKQKSPSLLPRNVVPDSELPMPRPQPSASQTAERETEIPKQSQSSRDVLKRLMNYLSQKYPDCEFKNSLILLEEVDSRLLKAQLAKEAEFLEKNSRRSPVSPRLLANERLVNSNQAPQTLVRQLLNSFGFSLPELFSVKGGAGAQLLKEEHVAELEHLDSLAPRQEIKIGCVYVPKGTVDERELLPVETSDTSFTDFLESLASVPGDEHFGVTGGLQPNEPIKFRYLGTPTIELVVHENSPSASTEESADSARFKRHLGNDSVLIIWHASADTFTERNCLRSEVTAAIIRILPHAFLPGWYHVCLQTCFERVVQPRKFARLRTDAFAVMADGGFAGEENRLAGFIDGPGGGVFSFDRVQGASLLVPQASLGAVVRALAITAAQKSYMLEGSRSALVSSGHSHDSLASTHISPADKVKLAPESVRKERIDSIIAKYGHSDLSYHRYLTKMF